MKLGTIARNSALLLLIEFTAGHLEGQERIKIGMSQHVFYRTVKVDGLSIFYREAGPKDAPTLLLLHGLPSSSRMFEPLFARLSDRYDLDNENETIRAITAIASGHVKLLENSQWRNRFARSLCRSRTIK